MSKKSLVLLSICLLIGAGVGLKLWADGCCQTDPLCHGAARKVMGTNCDYEFTVDLDSQYVEGTTVKLFLSKSGQAYVGYMMQLAEEPQDMCANYTLVEELDPQATYSYYFQSYGTGAGGDPDYEDEPTEYALVLDCD